MKRVNCILLVAILLSLIFCPVIQASAGTTNQYFSKTVNGVSYKFYYMENIDDEVGAFAAQKNSVSGHVDVPSEVAYSGKTYKVTLIDIGAFNGCTNLTSVTIPSTVSIIEQQSFTGCSNLETVTINGNVSSIGIYAFRNCTNLRNINLPNSLTSLGDGAFSACGFKAVTIPGSLKTVSNAAFQSCSKLETVTLQEGIKTIGDNGPFTSCTSLKTVYLPKSVTAINKNAFNFCSSLTDVYYNGTEKDKAAITIGDNNDYLKNATWHCKSEEAAAGQDQGQGQGQEKVTLSKLKSVKLTAVSAKKLKITWKKLTSKERKKIQKIQIQVSTDKKFTKIVKKTLLKSTKTSWTIPGLKKNTKYWVRIRAYTKSGNVINVSKWIVKSKKTKKK